MVCTVCGNERLSAMEYRLGEAQTCPAMSCDACGAIRLEEDAAQTDEERESVREAISTRKSISQNSTGPEDPVRETSPPPGPLRSD